MLARLGVRAYDAAQRTLGRLGHRPPPLSGSEDELLERAVRATGLDDFGLGPFREGLRVFLDACDHEASLTPFGRTAVRRQLVDVLAARLLTEAGWRRDPTCLTAPIRRPIFVLGLPRTGSTALHFLLAQDPANQVLEYWLAAAPGPRPPRATWEGDARFRAAKRGLRVTHALDPRMRAMHLMTAEGPDECRTLFLQCFQDETLGVMATVPSYARWLGQQDMLPAYARHADVLRLVQASGPERRWVLKYPAHLRNLRELLAIHPDAVIVQTHRDPARALPSLCSLVAAGRQRNQDRVDLRAIGREQLESWARAMEHGLDVRAAADPARFADLAFAEVRGDPLAAVRRIYARFDLELAPEAERRMRAWRAANPPDARGAHAYTIERFGLCEEEISERFARYTSHFGIGRESRGAAVSG